jgi:AcrR family transcriptional regulator
MLDKEEVKEAIITVARHIFSRFGFRKTTMDEIALAARKGKSSIYYYFASKEEIFQAVVEKEAGMLKIEMEKVIEQVSDPKEKLKAYVMVRMQTISKLANFYSAIKDEYLSHLDFIEKIRIKYDKDEILMVEKVLQEGVVNGEFKIENTSLAATAIVTALKGMEVPLFWEHEETNLQKRLDDLINILFYGVIKR